MAVADVEHHGSGAGVAAPLRDEQPDEDRLAGTRRADDERVADVALVQAEPERRRAVRLRPEQRRGVRREETARDGLRPAPRRRERQQVDHVLGREHGPAQVRAAVAGQRAEEGLDRVHVLDAAREAEVAHRLQDSARAVVRRPGVVCHHDGAAGEKAEADLAARVRRARGTGVVDHRRRVAVLEREVEVRLLPLLLRRHVLGPVARAAALLEPAELALADDLGRRGRRERDEAHRPAVREREPQQRVGQTGRRRVRVALDSNDADVLTAHARLEAAHERLVGERVVEVGPVARHAQIVPESCQTFVEVPHEVRAAHPAHAQRGGETVLYTAKLALELAEQATPDVGGRVALAAALDERAAKLPRERGWRRVRHRDDALGLVVLADRRVARAARLVDGPAHRVREVAPLARRVADGVAAERVRVDHPAVAERGHGRVDVAGEVDDLGRRRRGEVAAADVPRGEERAVLHQHGPLPHQESPAEQVGESARRARVLAEALEPGGPERSSGKTCGGGDKAHVEREGCRGCSNG